MLSCVAVDFLTVEKLRIDNLTCYCFSQTLDDDYWPFISKVEGKIVQKSFRNVNNFEGKIKINWSIRRSATHNHIELGLSRDIFREKAARTLRTSSSERRGSLHENDKPPKDE